MEARFQLKAGEKVAVPPPVQVYGPPPGPLVKKGCSNVTFLPGYLPGNWD